MITWSLKTFKVCKLKPYKKNPRYITEHGFKQLSESIAKFGLIDKPIVNSNLYIIGGHQRVNALKAAKVEEVECWIPDRHLDEKEVQELCIRLNKNTGDWQWETLANEWEMTDLLKWGFTSDELQIDSSAVEEALDKVIQEHEEKSIEEQEETCCPKCGHKFVVK